MQFPIYYCVNNKTYAECAFVPRSDETCRKCEAECTDADLTLTKGKFVHHYCFACVSSCPAISRMRKLIKDNKDLVLHKSKCEKILDTMRYAALEGEPPAYLVHEIPYAEARLYTATQVLSCFDCRKNIEPADDAIRMIPFGYDLDHVYCLSCITQSPHCCDILKSLANVLPAEKTDEADVPAPTPLLKSLEPKHCSIETFSEYEAFNLQQSAKFGRKPIEGYSLADYEAVRQHNADYAREKEYKPAPTATEPNSALEKARALYQKNPHAQPF